MNFNMRFGAFLCVLVTGSNASVQPPDATNGGRVTTRFTFYPRDAMLARSLRQRRVCLSVLSVRPSSLAERKQDREM